MTRNREITAMIDPPSNEKLARLWDEATDQSNGQIREDLVRWGVLEAFTEKVDFDLRQVWVDHRLWLDEMDEG